MPSSLTPVSLNTTGPSGSGSDQITPSSISNFNAAVSNGAAGPAVTPPAASGTTAELTALIKQLIPLLQQLVGGQAGPSAGGQAAPGGAQEGAAKDSVPAPAASSGTAPAPAVPASPKAGGADQLNTLIPQLITLLQNTQGEAAAPKAPAQTDTPAPAHADAASQGGSKSDLTSLLTQLIALLEKVLGTGGSSEAGKPGSAALADPAKTEGLVKQLITQLQPEAQAGAASPAPTPATPATPATGSAKQPDYTPGMGISGAEINAMIAAANGTGPEIVLSDWTTGTPSNLVPTTSPTAGGQVANLGAQVGNEAA